MDDVNEQRLDVSPDESSPRCAAGVRACARLHLRVGWWSLLVFLCLGAVLEGLHAFKAGFYLQPAGEVTRLMFTLAHVHGTLLGLVHVAFGVSTFITAWDSASRTWASFFLVAGSLLLPAGFLLGGIFASGGDPSWGIALVPVGAFALFAAVLLTARGISRIELRAD